jgi:hypothetical protein
MGTKALACNALIAERVPRVAVAVRPAEHCVPTNSPAVICSKTKHLRYGAANRPHETIKFYFATIRRDVGSHARQQRLPNIRGEKLPLGFAPAHGLADTRGGDIGCRQQSPPHWE